MPKEQWFAADGLVYTRPQERPQKKRKSADGKTTTDYDVCENCTRPVDKCTGTAKCMEKEKMRQGREATND